MRVVTRLEDLASHPRALAIGTFDGVHIGHRATVVRAVELARHRGLTSAVLTFDRHPRAVVDPGREPQLLTPLHERIRLIAALDPDELVLLKFDAALSAMTPERFCTDLLVDALQARVVVVGENFNFGAGGAGDAASLQQCGGAHGFETEVLSLLTDRGATISSTRIRQLMRSGEVTEARVFLGRPPSVTGRVVHGHGRGRVLGIPTANVAVPAEVIVPGRGVYAARAVVNGRWYRAAVNVGQNPTFGERPEVCPDSLEVFLLGFSGDVYERDIRVDFLARIRDERRFPDVQALVGQMRQDIATVAMLEDNAFTEAGLASAAVS